jgi:hypothetical protein
VVALLPFLQLVVVLVLLSLSHSRADMQQTYRNVSGGVKHSKATAQHNLTLLLLYHPDWILRCCMEEKENVSHHLQPQHNRELSSHHLQPQHNREQRTGLFCCRQTSDGPDLPLFGLPFCSVVCCLSFVCGPLFSHDLSHTRILGIHHLKQVIH